jgi:HPr kinase/phosphorylase
VTRARGLQVHATCVRLGAAGKAFGAPPDTGVLLLGKSGTGKSDLALRLIANGASLVADDRTELFLRRGKLHGRAPKRIAGLIEVRGLGIVEIPYTDDVRIALAVQLGSSAPRLPLTASYLPPEALRLAAKARPPLVRIVAQEASAAAKVAVAVAAHARGLFRDFVKTE